MAVHLNVSKSVEVNPAGTRSALPWWTWVVPFFVAYLGTWLSIWFITAPGVSLWYLPTALGIVMVYWWGPRALLGIYLNAVINTYLWFPDLDLSLHWHLSFLYALPETIEVGLSWLLFQKIVQGKCWMPDLKNVGAFLLLGSLIPTVLANTYLVIQLYLLGNIAQNTLWDNWRVLFSADMATQFVLSIPVLMIFTRQMNSKGWTQIKESLPQVIFLPEDRNSVIDIVFVATIFIGALILILLFPIHNLWILYGLLMILIAIRYGVNMAVIGTSWIGALAFLLPAILTGKLGLPTAGYGDFLTTNLDILFLCGVSLITGRAISDLFTEINERRQSEKALKESEERFRVLSDVSLEGIQIHDNGVILNANLALARQLGYRSQDEIIGKQIMQKHLTPESLKKAQEAGANKGEVSIYEVEGIRKDGTHFPVEVTSYTLNLNGKDIRIASTRDITKRKQTEENLRNAEIKYRTLVEQIPPIVYMAGPDQHIGVTYISPRIETLGFTAEEWLADPELWVRRLHPDDYARVMEEIEGIKESNKPFTSEYRLITRDGNVRWILDDVMDVADATGRLLFRQGFMLDITERKRVEESLYARERYLELLNEMTRAILLSNDFNSTLHTLAVDMAKLLNADDCYIAQWDEEKHTVIPVVATVDIEGSYASYKDALSEDLKLAWSVLTSQRAIAVEDVYNSPYVKAEFAKRYPVSSALGIPLIVGGHKLGTAIITFRTPRHFTADEIERSEQAGNQVALALWNFQQSLEIQQRFKESSALAEISRALSESERTGTGEVLQLIVDSARELMPHAEKSVVHLLDVEEQVLYARAVSGFDDQEKEYKQVKMLLGEGVAGEVIREGVTINIGDIKSNPKFLLRDSFPEFQSLLVSPVLSGGRKIGTISVQSATTNAFSTKDMELLNALGIQAAIAIENTRLFETTQQRLKEVGALYRTSQGLAVSLDADELIKDVVKLLQQNFGYYHVQIYLIEPESGNLAIRHGSGYIGDELVQKGHHLPAGEGIVGHVAETGKPFFTNNVDEVVFFKRNPLLPHTQSEIAVPIIVDKQVMGVLDIQTIPQQRLTEGDFQLMVAVADQLVVALQKAGLYSDLQNALQQEQSVRSQLIQSERLALVGRLLASVSHELNNPIQAIQNALFLIKEETNLSNQAKQDLDVILGEAERMAALIERLRTAYRPVRMKDFRPVELNDLIEDVHTLIAPHMRQKEIVFEFFPDVNLPSVSGLSDQIRQVVLNLFLNAIEVMKPGGRLTVLTNGLPQQNEVLLTVKDTGLGIDPEILPRIFEPFITSKHTGTGLGLTITHDIIEQHHGRIEAGNNPNEEGGAFFNIWLPIHEKG